MIKIIIPEIILFSTLIGVVLGEIGYLKERIRLSTPISVLGLLLSIGYLLFSIGNSETLFLNGGYYFDSFSIVLKLLIFFGAALSMFSICFSSEILTSQKSEIQSLVLGLALIACVLVSSGNLIVTFVALVSLWTISSILCGVNFRSTAANEAAIKTLVMGFVSSAFFILGVIILAKHAGSFYLSEIHVRAPIQSSAGVVSFWLILTGLAIQIGFFPVHYLIPDMTHGAPTPVAGILNVILRLTGFSVIARLWLSGFRDINGAVLFDWQLWLQVVSAATLLIGSFLALGQSGVKRLLGSLFLVESGFMMLGFSVLNSRIMGAALFSLFVQSFAILGVYYVLGFLIETTKSDQISSLRGIVQSQPFYSVIFIFLAIAVAAFPPFPGFFARFALISSVVSSGQIILGAISTLGMGLCWVATVRLIAPMIHEALSLDIPIQQNGVQSRRVGAHLVALLILLVLFTFTIFSNRIIQQSIQSVESIF